MGRAFEFRKERKMKRWDKMAKVFSRIGKDIVIAIKSGGSDPETNSKLRAVIQNARAANMPKDNVNRAIKRATDKDTSDYKEVTFEGYGPHGIAVLVETATDNNQRTVANVRSYFNKCGGSLGTSGSVSYMFDRKCHFKISAEAAGDLEEFELEMIDFGVEEIFAEDENVLIYAAFEDYGSLQSGLEERGVEIISSGFEQIPNVTKQLSAEQAADMDKLLEKIEDDDDVQEVFHNMITSE